MAFCLGGSTRRLQNAGQGTFSGCEMPERPRTVSLSPGRGPAIQALNFSLARPSPPKDCRNRSKPAQRPSGALGSPVAPERPRRPVSPARMDTPCPAPGQGLPKLHAARRGLGECRPARWMAHGEAWDGASERLMGQPGGGAAPCTCGPAGRRPHAKGARHRNAAPPRCLAHALGAGRQAPRPYALWIRTGRATAWRSRCSTLRDCRDRCSDTRTCP